MKLATVIVIRCNLTEDGERPCIHDDCAKCRLLAARLEVGRGPFEILGEAEEWK